MSHPPVLQLSQLELEKLDRDVYDVEELAVPAEPAPPALWGIPLKYISLVTLAVQNAALALIMHYSRVSTPPEREYSAAAAVLLNELLKGGISLAIAFARINHTSTAQYSPVARASFWDPSTVMSRFSRLGKEVFSPDCWKLSIPAILYVIQNNLQYVAASNLDAATFQVTYQMKILTTAFFSVILLRKRLSSPKWFALLLLAIGVATVQIQNGGSKHTDSIHAANPFTGFMAVTAACFTSGLAGVYFEMVLKNSQADLWVRNVQLSLFSLLPALAPIIVAGGRSGELGSFGTHLFRNFGPWAWATVAVQVFGGLVTALVIKYSDNILKGFATSLSIVISSLASVALFNFTLTFSFLMGSGIVLAATMLYSQPDCGSWTEGSRWRFNVCRRGRPALSRSTSAIAQISRTVSVASLSSLTNSPATSSPPSPSEESLPLFSYDVLDERRDSRRSLPQEYEYRSASSIHPGLSGQRLPSRTHSAAPTRAHSPAPLSPPLGHAPFSRGPSFLGTNTTS